MVQVRIRKVWNQVRIIFMGSAVLFSINIYFGFDNAFTSDLLPRAQALIHLHAGSIGWITLSLIGLAIWIFTGEREVSDSYVSRVRALTCAAIGIFGAYIVSFGIAYSRGGIRAWTWFGSFWVVIFVVLFIFAADIRLGAVVMGIGVLLGVGSMLLRLRADRPSVPVAARAA